MMTQSDSSRAVLRGGQSGWYDRIRDQNLRADLQRVEERIYSYADDLLNGWLGMAHEFAAAKPKLLEAHQWGAWIEDRFAGFIGLPTADRLAEIGQIERSELAALRTTYFQKGTGIKAIAAYLAAPEPVQELVKAGEVAPTASDIARAITAAEEAVRRAEERERSARLAQATFEEQIDEVRREAQLQGQLALQQATAALQREVDEARHQATLRQRDMEEAQRQIQRAQAEWDERLAYAKKEERDHLEADFTKQMRALQAQVDEQSKAAKKAQQQANELNERLTHARDSEAVRARWGVLAMSIADTVDAWLAKFPSVIDAQYFEAHERTLMDNAAKRLEILLRRIKELSQSSATVVESR
jgi:hypothetical protein